jgi:hypothetical protein
MTMYKKYWPTKEHYELTRLAWGYEHWDTFSNPRPAVWTDANGKPASKRDQQEMNNLWDQVIMVQAALWGARV